MGKCSHPSPCCGRRGIHERCDTGTWYQRCSKCGKPFSWTDFHWRARILKNFRWQERVTRFYRIEWLPEEYQDEIVDAVERLTVTYASLAGVTLPTQGPSNPPSHADAKVIQLFPEVRS